MGTRSKLLAAYKRTTVREKLLTLVFVLVIIVLWSNSWLSRYSEWNAARKQTEVELLTQQQWLDRRRIRTRSTEGTIKSGPL